MTAAQKHEQEILEWVEAELTRRLERLLWDQIPVPLVATVVVDMLPELVDRGQQLLAVRQGVEIASGVVSVVEERQ